MPNEVGRDANKSSLVYSLKKSIKGLMFENSSKRGMHTANLQILQIFLLHLLLVSYVLVWFPLLPLSQQKKNVHWQDNHQARYKTLRTTRAGEIRDLPPQGVGKLFCQIHLKEGWIHELKDPRMPNLKALIDIEIGSNEGKTKTETV